MNKKLITICLVSIFLITSVGLVFAENDSHSISVKISWDDNGATDRPGSVNVNLMKDGAVVDTATLSEANSWKATFDVSDDGNYKVTQADIADYSTKIVKNGDNFVITNKIIESEHLGANDDNLNEEPLSEDGSSNESGNGPLAVDAGDNSSGDEGDNGPLAVDAGDNSSGDEGGNGPLAVGSANGEDNSSGNDPLGVNNVNDPLAVNATNGTGNGSANNSLAVNATNGTDDNQTANENSTAGDNSTDDNSTDEDNSTDDDNATDNLTASMGEKKPISTPQKSPVKKEPKKEEPKKEEPKKIVKKHTTTTTTINHKAGLPIALLVIVVMIVAFIPVVRKKK